MLPLGLCHSECCALPPRVMVTSRPGCCKDDVFGPIAAKVCVATKGCMDYLVQRHNMCPCWCPWHAASRAILIRMTCASTLIQDFVWAQSAAMATFGSMVLLQLGSVLMSVALVTSRAHGNHAWWNQTAMLSQP